MHTFIYCEETSLISTLQVLILTCTQASMGFLFSSQLKTAGTAWMTHYLLQHLSAAEQQDIDPVHLRP
jgi:hypothetical protein